MKLVLGSSSPIRLQLLRESFIYPDAVISPDVDETEKRGELPRHISSRLSYEKALAVQSKIDYDAFIIGADSVVSCGRQTLPKDETDEDVTTYLNRV